MKATFVGTYGINKLETFKSRARNELSVREKLKWLKIKANMLQYRVEN